MVLGKTRQHKNGLPKQTCRALLLSGGHTFASIARELGCSARLVRKIVNGERPGLHGTSLKIRHRVTSLTGLTFAAQDSPASAH